MGRRAAATGRRLKGLETSGYSPAMPLSKPFEQLQEGDSFSTGERTITEGDVLAFADLSGDSHPQHVDAEWAAGSKFGERVGHGMLTLSCAFGLMPIDPGRALALRRMSDALFVRPVKLGDTIRVDGRVVSLAPAGDGVGLVTLRLVVRNQDDRIVCRATAEVLWRATLRAEQPPHGL